jgi:hypothetical protein
MDILVFILQMELLPEHPHALVISTSQLVYFAKPGVDIVIERHRSPTGISCNFLVTNNNNNNNTNAQCHS